MGGVAGQTGAEPGRTRLVGAHSEHDGHRERGDMVGQVLQHGQRFAVRPVQVLQHHDGATPGGQPAQNPQHRLGEHHRRRRHRREGRAGRPVRYQRPQRGKIRCQERVIRTAAVAQPIQQRLAERPQRRDPVRRRRTTGQDQLPPPARPRGCLGDQPGLADPRFAGDHNAGAATAGRPAEHLRQRGQFFIPADNDGTPHARIVARTLLNRHRRPMAQTTAITQAAAGSGPCPDCCPSMPSGSQHPSPRAISRAS
jgi:hypothetical protein